MNDAPIYCKEKLLFFMNKCQWKLAENAKLLKAVKLDASLFYFLNRLIILIET